MGLILAAGKGSRMKSDLPKVLHQVHGKPMVTCCLDALEAAGVKKNCVVVGYRQELVREELGDRVMYAVQKQQRGTGDAVAAAADQIRAHNGRVVIVYGDAPLLSSESLKKLADACIPEKVAGAILTITLDNPPVAGRIIRDDQNRFVRVVEEQDCTDEQKLIREINVGTYCFKSEPLLHALDCLKPNNEQGEYYLTDVPAHLFGMGHSVETIAAQDLFESLGVNDKRHLEFAEMATNIKLAEKMIPLVDAALQMRKS
ncbi:MAG: NTP transferase domain-containing protein [Myxococcota bacterium]